MSVWCVLNVSSLHAIKCVVYLHNRYVWGFGNAFLNIRIKFSVKRSGLHHGPRASRLSTSFRIIHNFIIAVGNSKIENYAQKVTGVS